MKLLKNTIGSSLLAAGLFSGLNSQAIEKINWNFNFFAAEKVDLHSKAFLLTRDLGVSNFSDEFKMPLNVVYDSKSLKSGMLGYRWNIPQLESKVYHHENEIYWDSPWGRRLDFVKMLDYKDELAKHNIEIKDNGYISPYKSYILVVESDKKWTIHGIRANRGWSFEYQNGKLQKITSPYKRSINYNYNQNGLLISVEQQNTKFIELTYNNDNNVASLKINGTEHKFGYSLIKTVRLPEAQDQKVLTLAKTSLTSIQKGILTPEIFKYDNFGFIDSTEKGGYEVDYTVQHETEAERLELLKKYSFDSKDFKLKTKNGRLLQDEFYSYSYNNGAVKVINQSGGDITYKFDDKAGKLYITSDGNTFTTNYYQRFDVAYNYKVESITLPCGHTADKYIYDDTSALITKVVKNDGNKRYYQYDQNDNLILESRLETENGYQRRPLVAYKYNKNGYRTHEIRLDKKGDKYSETVKTFDDNGNVLSTIASNNITCFKYNKFGYVTETVDSLVNHKTNVSYDKFNRIVLKSCDNETTSYSYDMNGNVINVTTVDSANPQEQLSNIEYKYNNFGALVAVYDNNKLVQKLDRDNANQITAEVASDGSKVEFKYNKLNQLAKVIDQNGNPISFDYDKYGKMISRTTAENQQLQKVYNHGEFAGIKNIDVNTNTVASAVSVERDKFHRIVKETFDGGKTKHYEYNALGLLSKLTAVDGKNISEEIYSYDEFDRLSKKIINNTINGKTEKTVHSLAYNNYDQRKWYKVTYPNGFEKVTNYQYDKLGRMTALREGQSEILYSYNNQSKLVKKTVDGVDTHFKYNKTGQLVSKIMGPVDSPIASLNYEYDKKSQVTARVVNGKKENYSYDLKGQLLTVTDAAGNILESYKYDAAGNVLARTNNGKTVSFSYDKANQLVSQINSDGSVIKFSYDAAGRMIKEGNKAFYYGWNDKVISIVNNGKITHSYNYLASGQLSQAVINGKINTYHWDNLALIRNNAINYINEPHMTGGAIAASYGAENKVMFNDNLATTLGTFDGDSFTASEVTAFGRAKNPAFYTGKPHISGLGYNFLHRNYRADLNKWQTADPIGYPDGYNNYAYVNNRFINCFDIFGCDGTYEKKSTCNLCNAVITCSQSYTGDANDSNISYTTAKNNVDTAYAKAIAKHGTGPGQCSPEPE